MKASPFTYLRIESADHAVAELAQAGADARLIAGGQSLVPMMAMRLATPSVLLDINHLPLDTYEVSADGIRTGATLRQCDLHDQAGLKSDQPLLFAAMPWVGHRQTRNRGTVGGSIVQADPSAELPLAAAVLGATLCLKAPGGDTRQINASHFYEGPLQTQIGDDELLESIEWPVWGCDNSSKVAAAFDEIAIRHGDFALASAACQVRVNADGMVLQAAFGLGGVGPTPLTFVDLAGELVGQVIDENAAAEVASRAASECEPDSDMHASAAYRRNLARVLLQRALLSASSDARTQARQGG